MNEYGALVEKYCQGKIQILREKTVPVPCYPQQIQYELAWDQTWVSTVRGWQLITLVLARTVYQGFLHSALSQVPEYVPLQTRVCMWFMHDGATPPFNIAVMTFLNDKYLE
jgi:hypothetical protein